MTPTHRNLILAYIALQCLDVASTFYFLSTPHGVEGNPVILLFMTYFGAWWWVPKLALAASTIPVFMRGRARYVAAMTGLYALVVVNNIMI